MQSMYNVHDGRVRQNIVLNITGEYENIAAVAIIFYRGDISASVDNSPRYIEDRSIHTASQTGLLSWL